MARLTPLIPQSSANIWQTLASEEMYAHLLYIHISNMLQSIGFFGGQKFFESESDGELEHYKKIRDFLNNCNLVIVSVKVYAISISISSLGDALQAYYDAEVALLNAYLDAYKQMDESDPEDCASEPLILEFIKIQTDSVGEAADLLKRFEIATESKEILLFDRELGN